jgi:hypothetical protein
VRSVREEFGRHFQAGEAKEDAVQLRCPPGQGRRRRCDVGWMGTGELEGAYPEKGTATIQMEPIVAMLENRSSAAQSSSSSKARNPEF